MKKCVTPKIAVIYAEGTITYFEEDKKFDETVTPEKNIQKELAITSRKNTRYKRYCSRVKVSGRFCYCFGYNI